MRMPILAAVACVVASASATTLGAQSLATRATQTDGIIQVIYPSRPEACGDGETFISNVLGRSRYFTNGGIISGRNGEVDPRCVHGPARVVATVERGEVTKLRTYVGPVPRSDARTMTVSVADAREWLEQLVTRSVTRVSRDAVLPLILVDSTEPWPVLLGVARDERRPESLRRNALMWVSDGVNEHLGIADATADTDDDELRKQAVFVLSQRARRDGTAELMDVARTSKRPAVRRDAMFWLSQTGEIDSVANLYAELLGGR